MKKILFLILIVFLIICNISCNNKSKNTEITPLCISSSAQAFATIQQAMITKDISIIRSIEAAKIDYFDTIMSFKYPLFDVIPKQKDGAFGEFDKGDTYLFYLFIKDDNILKGARVLQLKNVSGCWKIWNFTNFKIDNELKNIYNDIEKTKAPTEENKKKEYAYVTSIADGIDLKEVNLWSSTDGNTRKIVGTCINNERVEVLYRSDPYVLVRKNNGIEGFFIEGFLK